MREDAYWSTVRDNLSPFGKLVRIETSTALGVPDVAYALRAPNGNAATGWIELKSIDGFPKRDATRLHVETLTLEQVAFAEDWTAAGGRAFLLLKAPPWHFLFEPAGIRGVFEDAVRAGDAFFVARAFGKGNFPTGRVLRALTGPRAGGGEPARRVGPVGSDPGPPEAA